jgi:hypothetical protein
MAARAVFKLSTLMPTPSTLTRFIIYDLPLANYDFKIYAVRKSQIVNY